MDKQDNYKMMKELDLTPGTTISEYVIQGKIGQGGFGSVFLVKKKDTDQKYAMKFEYTNSPHQTLFNEIRVLYALRDSKYFPKMIDDGVYGDYYYCVMDLRGPSLSKVRKEIDGKKMSYETVLAVALEMLNAIEELHSKGYVHCDIKPSNFLLNLNSDTLVSLVDFGLSEYYLNPRTKKIRKYEKHSHFTGTYLYSSVNIHKRKTYAPRDDLISWFYSVVELLKGELPWSNVIDKSMIQKKKEKTSIFKLCSDLPTNFYKIWFYINSLKYSKTPNYNIIRKLLNEMIEKSLIADVQYDWEKIPKDKLPMLKEFNEHSIKIVNSKLSN